VATAQQALELLDRAGPDPGQRVIQRLLELGRESGGRRDGMAAARDVELTLHAIGPLAGCLVRGGVADLVVDVLVQLVECDHAVLVEVRLPGLEALDERAGEYRRRWRGALGKLLALERILERAGRGDHRAAAAAKALVDVNRRAAPGRHASLERARVAAVEQQHHAPGPAAVHAAVDELRRDRGRAEAAQLGVPGGEVELAVLVLDAVAGEVQQ
jgi:hypothetical protein